MASQTGTAQSASYRSRDCHQHWVVTVYFFTTPVDVGRSLNSMVGGGWDDLYLYDFYEFKKICLSLWRPTQSLGNRSRTSTVVTLEDFQVPKDKNCNQNASRAPRPGEREESLQSVKEILPCGEDHWRCVHHGCRYFWSASQENSGVSTWSSRHPTVRW